MTENNKIHDDIEIKDSSNQNDTLESMLREETKRQIQLAWDAYRRIARHAAYSEDSSRSPHGNNFENRKQHHGLQPSSSNEFDSET